MNAADFDADAELALTALVMQCPELLSLETLLGRFNIFRVLRAARTEIRHSNMLGWLLTHDESHGLETRFLRRWLMNVIHDVDKETSRNMSLPSPIEIDALEIDRVEVAREWENIDLLVNVKTAGGATWIICIENKVESAQHSDQLRRYRDIVENRFSDAKHRIFLFLTKHDEEPEDDSFITTSYEVIERILRICLEERGDAIGIEPRFLITQYLELLEEDFVNESRAVQLARQIYRSHRKAIDFILENRNDPILEASRMMEEMLSSNSNELGIVMSVQNKGYVRFVPQAWNIPQNKGGTIWGADSRYVICEINFWPRKAELHMTVVMAPDEWADRVWARAASAPFKQEWKKRPAKYIKPFKAKSDILVANIVDEDPEDARSRLFEWVQSEMRKDQFREAVRVIRELLEELT